MARPRKGISHADLIRVLDTLGASYREETVSLLAGTADPAVIRCRTLIVCLPNGGQGKLYFEGDRYVHPVDETFPLLLRQLKLTSSEFWTAYEAAVVERGSARP